MKSCAFNLSALWAFEGCLLIASYISTNAFASQVVLMQILLIFLAIPYGMGVVAYDLISDSIDHRDHVEARSMAECMQKVALILGGILVLLVSNIRSNLVGIYTKDLEIQEQCKAVWVPFMIFMFSYSTNFVVSGALRAVSSVHDRFTYRITQSGYWLIAAPASIIAVFTYDVSLLTLWICMAVSVSIISPISFY